MMMNEACLALYEQSEANAVFRPKRGDEHDIARRGKEKNKREKEYVQRKTENSYAGSRANFICTCKQLLDHCTTRFHSVFSEVNFFVT